MEELRVGDIVVLNGIDGKVVEMYGDFYMKNTEGESNMLLLAMGDEEACRISLGVLGYAGKGFFPECLSLDHLTKFVGALLEWEAKNKPQVECGKMLTWKSSMAKVLWAKFVGEHPKDVEELFTEGSPMGNRLKETELSDMLTEEAIDITIDGLEYYIRKSEVEKLNLISNA